MKKEHLFPKEYYTSRLEILRFEALNQKRKLRKISYGRLLVFLSTIFLLYRFYNGWFSLIYIGVPGLIIFIYLISKYTDLKGENIKTLKLIKLNELELEVLQGKFYHLPDGLDYNDPLHEFCSDIDLFGKGSFFQYLNRTSLKEGELRLADLLKANDPAGIPERQEALKELAEKADWRQEFVARGSLIHTEISSEVLIKWMKKYRFFIPESAKMISVIFAVISLIFISGVATGLIYENFLLLWFFMGLGITARYFKQINQLSEQTSKLKNTFDQYYQLMNLLEQQKFESPYFKKMLAPIQHGSLKCSLVLKQFSNALDALDQRNNMLFGVLANGFLLWDLYQAKRIEVWIKVYNTEVERWIDLITFFDANVSLANFVFNHPQYTFPKITSGKRFIKAVKAAHPLIDPDKCVKNDIEIHNGEFLVITGANMAGKSTFLRTVSLLITMANTGLPVCASLLDYSPTRLITSMRTSDSLTDDESYFFSELKRLKFIVNKIQADKYFVILDEILKGTNSVDKASGSKKFIEKLVGSGTTGMVATHDLSLCELEEEMKEVKTYYFDAEIKNNELHFDYILKKGVCKNMNASFLLKKMKII